MGGCYDLTMADKLPAKKNQLTLEEYLKLKDKRAKSKLKLHFPWLVRFVIAIPAAYLVFLIVYFMISLRFIAEH